MAPEKALIESTVPLDEWGRELLRVDKELTKFEMQLKINQKDSYLKDYEKTRSVVKKTH